MNLNWLGIFSAILALLAFWVVYRGAGKCSRRNRGIFALAACVIAIPGASFAIYYAHVLPETDWYYQFRSIWGTELLIAWLGIAGGVIATLLPRALLVVPLLGVVVFSAAPVIKPFISPIPKDAWQDKWDAGVCLQSTPSTCGAASTATILNHFGVEVTESEIAAEAYSYGGGTEAWHLARAARKRGFDVDFKFTPGLPQDDGLPAVVGVRLGSIGHFIPIIGRDGDRYRVGDPLHGQEWLTRDELLERYDLTGFCMRIRRSGWP